MERISDEIFEPVMGNDFLARAWLLRWKKSIHAYLDAQLNRESSGWRYREGETPFELALADDLTMHGRVDRVDIMADGSDGVCVLDYKMTGANTLRNKLKEAGEDVQLACYAYVHKASTAAFISIEKDKVVAVAPQQDVGELAGSNIQRLLEVFTQMRGGAALPAHGTRDACKYCEMHGLCRKSEWSTL
jgi:ATP-dependent helicase/nuclease subunit B